MEEKESNLDKPLPLWGMVLIPVYVLLVLLVSLLLIAWDWWWLEAWIFSVPFAVTFSAFLIKINRDNPRVLRNRMKTKKEGLTAATRQSAGSDQWLFPLIAVGFLGALLLPALGYRLGWPRMALPVEIGGVVLTIIGLVIVMQVMLQNAYASKLLDINQEQKLIDTGLYSKVRHPMYSGFSLMIIAVPVALGSIYGLFPALLAVQGLILRIRFEEEMLLEGIDGYQEYKQKVRYRLIPRIF